MDREKKVDGENRGATVVPLDPRRQNKERCPICNQPSLVEVRPFCSPRCANVDLGRWLKGNYRFPSAEAPMFEDGDPDGEES